MMQGRSRPPGQEGCMLLGWKSITAATGFCPRTIKRLARTEGFPLAYITRRPVTSRQLIEGWLHGLVKQADQVDPVGREGRAEEMSRE